MDADREDAERTGAVGGHEVGEGAAGGLFLPEHRQPDVAQVDGIAVAAGGEEAGGDADGNGPVADHPVQHGLSFRGEFW